MSTKSEHREPPDYDDNDDSFQIPDDAIEKIPTIDVKDAPDEITMHKKLEQRPKVLITGAKGQLGVDLADVLALDFNLMLTDIDEMDITNPDNVMATFALFEPDIVIHAAAYTNVDDCESNQSLAFKVNAMGTQNVALACQDYNSRLLYISTDYVFDGKSDRPYREYMATAPINVYGESKLMGEQIVQHLVHRHLIVRTSWLFGAHGNNFVKTMLKLSLDKGEIGVVNDQWGRPTYTADLAKAIMQLINTPFYGIYHVSNPSETTWCRFARKILEMAGRETIVNPITTEQFPRPARRPAYSVLDDFIWRTRGFPILRPWEESIAEFLQHPKVIEEFPFLRPPRFEE